MVAKPTQAKPKEPIYFGALDGFRGLLAIMIATYHTFWLSHVNASALYNNGPVLVDIFFVFSGFLMFTLYDGQLNSGQQARAFMKRRIARIYPLHFFMLMVALLYGFARVIAHAVGIATYTAGETLPFQNGDSDTIWSFLSNLTLTHSMGIHDSLSFNMPSWTVSVEFFAYFVFVGMLLWLRPKKPWHFMLLTALIAVNYFVLSRLKPNMDFHFDLGFWRCLGGFFTGIIVAYCYRNIRPMVERYRSRNSDMRVKWVATAAETVSLATLFCFVVYFPGKAQFFIAPVAFIFVLGFAFDLGLISRAMSIRPMRYIAKISYSIYMVHVLISICFGIFAEKIVPVIWGGGWNESLYPGDLLLLPYLAVVLIFSHFTYHFVEVPGRKAIMAYDFSAIRRKIFKGGLLSKT